MPNTEPTPEQTPGRPSRWPLVVAVVITAIAVAVTLYVNAANTRYVECHTDSMNQLHTDLYASLDDDPANPDVWGPEWVADFETWQDRMAHCGAH